MEQPSLKYKKHKFYNMFKNKVKEYVIKKEL